MSDVPLECVAARTSWELLRAGNVRFQTGVPYHPVAEARAALTAGQAPRAAVLGCADSRVPVELVFGAAPGEIFTVRTAGHVLSPGVIGSLEYAADVLGVPLLVILGHEACGALAAARHFAATGATLAGHMAAVVNEVAASLAAPPPTWLSPLPIVAEPSAEARLRARHVRGTLYQLVAASPLLTARIRAGKLGVAGAEYHLATGAVTLLPCALVG